MSVNEEALSLPPIEKIHLIDELLLSLDLPSKELDEIWSQEVEERIKAYDKGISETEVFAKYRL